MNRQQVSLFQPSLRRQHPLRSRWRREWCFVRAAAKHLRNRVLLMMVILLGGGLAFKYLEPEKGHSLQKATYYTWSLVFGEPPEEFPESPFLQALFFLVPVLGLTVIIEGIVDLSLMLRDRRRYERSWCIMMAESLSRHIVLVGLGKLGFKTYRVLHQLGEPIVVIERNPESQFLEEVRRDGTPVLVGDARREALLNDANIARAKSVILATDDDLANLEIALDARKLAPDIRVVLRMFDQNMADKIREGFGLHIAMSQSAISAPAFAVAAIESSIVGSFIVGDQLIVMQRWEVREGGRLANKSVGQVIGDHGISVIEHRPGGRSPARLFPPPATMLNPGDELLIQAPFHTIDTLRVHAGAEPAGV